MVKIYYCVRLFWNKQKKENRSALSENKKEDQGNLVPKHRFRQILLHAQNKGGRPHMDIAWCVTGYRVSVFVYTHYIIGTILHCKWTHCFHTRKYCKYAFARCMASYYSSVRRILARGGVELLKATYNSCEHTQICQITHLQWSGGGNSSPPPLSIRRF